MSPNLKAFLWTIRTAEGTAIENGYRIMFGYRYFDDFSDHPRQPAQFRDGRGKLLWTSAAGAYQFMAKTSHTTVDTWDRLQKRLKLPDFSPESQDKAAVELIREAGALDDVEAGHFAQAIHFCRGIWASLPGAGYGQPERKLATLQKAYTDAGGSLA
jgi:lysozyme